MLKRLVPGLLLLATFSQPLPVHAQAPSRPATNPSRLPDTYRFADVEERLHEQYPEYVGFEVYDGTLFLNVDSLDASVRLRVLRDVVQAHASFLEGLRTVPGRVRFLHGVPDVDAWIAAGTAVRGIRGVTGVYHGSRIERLVIELQYPNQRHDAERRLRAAGVFPNAVLIITPAPPPFPTGPALDGGYQATLQVSSQVRQGEQLPITLYLRNLGDKLLTFAHGACDFHLEIRRVETEAVVLPGEGQVACLDVGYRVALLPGQAVTLAARTWRAQGTDGRALTPGEYEVRAVFGPVGLPNASQRPTQYIHVAPVRFMVIAR
ncbi:hypothetical protein [Deinococcus hohokamensis]|uniref:Intracellular proteinase inhibitor BsuPI domain-containing protein n=1 Tax=Deinococcus hohokamensis TaxID=309883 RepID=A0ABV9I6T9_9DEIO